MKLERMSLDLDSVYAAYAAGTVTPVDLVREVLRRVEAGPTVAWLALFSEQELITRARAIMKAGPDGLPLYGIPFAVKDNIDVAGLPTTAGCPAYANSPKRSAFVVAALERAGAIVIGKTHLDQFATGLVGTRAPVGPCPNAFKKTYISGGSSSGSAVAVALGQVSFALGTDTAGSGRVPAAFNNIVGLKPTRGRLSTRGVVPACRSLDCVSIFAALPGDAARLLEVAGGDYDARDPFARDFSKTLPGVATGAKFVFGVPAAEDVELESPVRKLWTDTIRGLEKLGGKKRVIDFRPFRDAARLLYEGPWLAERYAAVGRFIEKHPDSVLPVTRDIILAGGEPRAVDAFRATYKLAELRRKAEKALGSCDFILTPTAPEHYTIAAVREEPFALNARLGTYCNYMNLLDLSAVALPAGMRADGLPFGVTIFADAGADVKLLSFAQRFLAAREHACGAKHKVRVRADNWPAAGDGVPSEYGIVVCGAHMSGMALNHQLLERGAKLLRKTRTAPVYRFYALGGGGVARPGMVRAASGGASIEVEVWSLPAARWGDFIDGIPAPLGIGSVELKDGSRVKGFLCESLAVETIPGTREITHLGSWRKL